MSHLSDGQLHAYLDTGLGAVEDSVAEELRSHLEACPDCQARLADAREVRDEAAELLSVTGPASMAPPPFEELERRASAGVPARSVSAASTRRRAGPQSLAWAASLAIALTAGWLARGTVGSGVPGRIAGPSLDEAVGYRETTEVASPLESRKSEVSLDRPTDLNESVPGSASNVAEQRTLGDDLPPAEPQTSERGPLDQVAGRDSVAGEVRADLKSAEMDRADLDRPEEPADEFFATGEAQGETEGEEMPEVAADPVAAERRMAKAAAPVGVIAGTGATTSAGWTPVDRSAAEELLGGKLRTLETLPVISVRARSAEGSPEVWTSQQLASGHTLDLVQAPENVGSAGSEGGYETSQQLRWVERIRIDGFLIEARAPLPPDSLRALLSELRN
jgi:hypothetical protein